MAADNLPALIAQAEDKVKQVPALAEKHGAKVKIALAAVAAIVAAPFVLMGIGGLIGGTIIVAGAYAVMHFAPVYAKRVQNMKQEMLYKEANRYLESLKAEARKNPIETMQNVWLEQGRKLKSEFDKIGKFAQKVSKYGQQLNGLKQQFPGETATFDKVFQDMNMLLQKRRTKWQDSKGKHELAAKEIEKCQAFWEMGLATQDLRESAADVEQEFMQKIRKETAIDAVMDQLASSMADLDQLMMEEVDLHPISSRQDAITNNPSPTIDVPSRVVNTVSAEATSRREA